MSLTNAKKPAVLGLALVLLVRAVTLVLNIPGVQLLNSGITPDGDSFALSSLNLAIIVVGLLFSAYLVFNYKRSGLLLTLLLSILDLVFGTIAVAEAAAWTLYIPGLAINLWMLYYLIKYLRREPEKTFFT